MSSLASAAGLKLHVPLAAFIREPWVPPIRASLAPVAIRRMERPIIVQVAILRSQVLMQDGLLVLLPHLLVLVLLLRLLFSHLCMRMLLLPKLNIAHVRGRVSTSGVVRADRREASRRHRIPRVSPRHRRIGISVARHGLGWRRLGSPSRRGILRLHNLLHRAMVGGVQVPGIPQVHGISRVVSPGGRRRGRP